MLGYFLEEGCCTHEAGPLCTSSRCPAEPRAGGLMGSCCWHVPFPKGYADTNKLILMASLQFSLASS